MSLGQDLRYAVRGLAKSPGFAAVAVITLALGIGANAAIFSVLRAVLFRPLPYPDPEELVVVGQDREPGKISTVSHFDFVDWQGAMKSFSGLAAWHDEQITMTGGDKPVRLRGMASSANMFSVLAATPALGRGFAAGEDVSGRNRVAVLSHGAWLRHFGGDPAVVGRTVTLDDLPYVVVGVLGRDFRFPMRDEDPEIWVPRPRPWDDAMIPRRAASYLNLVARLAPGATAQTAQAELEAEAAREAKAYPDELANRSVTVRPLHDVLVEGVRPALLLLFGAVGFVLLIACANVANLLLARAGARHREIAIRVALGASRGRIVRALLVESVVLALAGGGLGVVLALWGLDALHALVPAKVAAIGPITVDTGVLAFSLLVAAGTGIAFGLFPAVQASTADPQDALREGRATSSNARQRARSLLVAAEIAVAAVLLVGAALVILSFTRLVRVDPGLDANSVVTTSVFLPDTRYREPGRSFAFYQTLLEKLDAVPGVSKAAIGFPLPFSDNRLGNSYLVEGEPPPAPGQEPSASINVVSPSWFATLGIPLKVGRILAKADDRADAAPVIVVSERLARHLFPDGKALGHRLIIDWNGEAAFEIVGVVGDVRTDGLDRDPRDEVYIPFGRMGFPLMNLAVRSETTGDLSPVLAAAVQSVDTAMPIAATVTLATSLRGQLGRQRLITSLLGLFGGLALFLALVGVYGVMSYTVAQRRREMGIRLALGAQRAAVVRLVVGHAIRLAAVGSAVGLIGALFLTRLLSGLLYGVSVTEPVIFLAVGPCLVLVAALAAYLPARRAARTDPLSALRAE